MEIVKLIVSARGKAGKGAARQSRLSGAIPGVLYGGDKEPASLTIDRREFDHLIHGAGENAVVELQSDNDTVNGPALIKDVQHHPVRHTVMHADFQRIRLDEKIKTVVPIELTGRAVGIIDGGVLDHTLRELEVECLALEVPEMLTYDITEMNIGDIVHISDMTIPDNLTVLTDLDRTLCTIHQPRVLETTEEEVEGEEGVVEGEAPAEGEESAEDAESSDS